MGKLKPSNITRIEKIERATDVEQMTPGELEHHASRCPADIREQMKKLSDKQLKRIINGESYHEVTKHESKNKT